MDVKGGSSTLNWGGEQRERGGRLERAGRKKERRCERMKRGRNTEENGVVA